MQDLFEFPYVEYSRSPNQAIRTLAEPLGILSIQPLSPQVHSFTRYRAELTPFLVEVAQQNSGLWLELKELKKRPFSSGHKRILQEVAHRDRLRIEG